MFCSLLHRTQLLTESVLSQSWLALAARIAVASPFLVSGILKLADFPGAVAEVRGLTGLEPAGVYAALVIVTQIGAAALLIAAGRFAWIGAAALAGFTTIATLYAHAFWRMPQAERVLNRNIFIEHISIIGGLVLLAILSTQRHKGTRSP